MCEAPHHVRARYYIYVTSDKADCTFVGEVDKPTVPFMSGTVFVSHVTDVTAAVIRMLNESKGVADFRPMTAHEVEMFVSGLHPHNSTEEAQADRPAALH